MKVVSHFRDADLFTRLLVIGRPSICPLEPILDWIPANASVLDVGCGVGLLSITLAASSKPRRVSGFDVNPIRIIVGEISGIK